MEVDDMDSNFDDNQTDNQVSNERNLHGLEESEELVCDQSAYVMLHQAETGAPCLSFDILHDNLGDNRSEFPLTAFVVSGTQSSDSSNNSVLVLKMTNLHKTQKNEEEDDDDDSDDENESSNPILRHAEIKHLGCVNRIRSTRLHDTTIAATWSEHGRVYIWDLNKQINAVNDPHEAKVYKNNKTGLSIKPVFTFTGHQIEGYGLDWSPIMPGVLATGDCKKNIHVWRPTDDGSWHVDQQPLIGHSDSVEDIQWSPNENNVMATCSVDKSIRIWDIRCKPNSACKLVVKEAHSSDVNVINWNKIEPFIVSGGDDGKVCVWDLRQFQTEKPLALFKHHTAPVTTVEWHPTEGSIFASGGSDNQISQWDLAVEKDSAEIEEGLEDLPPQLLFVHQGQSDIKELHWHPQMPGVVISTALSGFNIFRTISV